ncbi:hypothetical protein HDV04_002905 [Boothiomyces sp. JEL0838]|nr:hypothetical protein HDV04_002905 [Boothiomyces sp. JEL0838]
MCTLEFAFNYEGLVLMVDILKMMKFQPDLEWLNRLEQSLGTIVELFTSNNISIRRKSFQIIKLMLEIKPVSVDLIIDGLYKYRVGIAEWWESLEHNTTEFCGLHVSVNDKHSFQLGVMITLELHYLMATNAIPYTNELVNLQLLYPATNLFQFILELFGDHDFLLISTLQKLCSLSKENHSLQYDIHPVKLFLNLLDHFDFDSTVILDLILDLQSTFVQYLISVLSFDIKEIKSICIEANSLDPDTDYYSSLVSTLLELKISDKDLESLINKLSG